MQLKLEITEDDLVITLLDSDSEGGEWYISSSALPLSDLAAAMERKLMEALVTPQPRGR